MREKAYCSDEHLCLYSAYGILNNENVKQLFTIYVFSLIKLALSFLIHKMGTIIFFSSGFVYKMFSSVLHIL